MSIDVNVQNDLVIVTESSEDITVNVSNARGADGVGVPTGGTTGQVLKKLSNTNYDTYWALDGGGVPYSGATGQVDLGNYDLKVQGLTIGKGNNSLVNNTALGHSTLLTATTGNFNTAVGYESLRNTTTGQYNTAVGQSSLFSNTTGGQNTALGLNALLSNTTGSSNVAVGLDTLQHITTGSSNTAIGYNAGSHITGGSTPNTTATNSVFIGRDSKANADGQTNQIVIGQNAVGNGSNTATFGNTATTANYFTGSINGGSFVKSGGTSSQFLKADGSVDSSTYTPTARTLTINGTTQDLSADRTFTVSADNIYTANGTLTGNRVVTMGANTLSFFGSNYVSVTHDNTRTLSFIASNSGSFIQSFSNFGTSAKGKMLLNWDGGQVIIGGLSTENANNNVKIFNGFEVEATAGQSLLLTNNNSSDPTLNLRRTTSATNYGVGYKFSLWNASGSFVEYASIYGGITNNTTGSQNGFLTFHTATSGTSTEKMRLTAAGRLLLGTTTEGTDLLLVNGTARVNDNLLVRKDQNANTSIRIENTTSGTGAGVVLQLYADTGNVALLGRNSSTYSAYKAINTNDAYLYTSSTLVVSDIVLQTDGPNNLGKIKFAAGSSSTPQMTLTAAGRLLLGTTTESTFMLDVNGTARVSGNTTIVGSTNLSTSNALSVTNSVGNVLFSLRNDKNLITFADSSVTFNLTTINSASSWLLSLANSYITGPNFLSGLNQYFGSSDGSNVVRYMAGNGANGLKIEIGTTATFEASALLQVTSTTKGFLPPRMTTTQKNAISSPAAGLQVYDTTLNQMSYYNGTTWVNF